MNMTVVLDTNVQYLEATLRHLDLTDRGRFVCSDKTNSAYTAEANAVSEIYALVSLCLHHSICIAPESIANIKQTLLNICKELGIDSHVLYQDVFNYLAGNAKTKTQDIWNDIEKTSSNESPDPDDEDDDYSPSI